MVARALAAFAAFMLGVTAGAAQVQPYPARTIRLLTPFAAGGGTDYVARSLAQQLSDANKWTVVVENKTGANGTLGLAETVRADPAGYDLVLGQLDNVILSAILMKVSFDSVRDFTPIAMAAKTPIVVVVASKSPYRSFADLLQAARAQPNVLTVGSSGTGGSAHLTNELLRKNAGLELRHVPYRGSAPALTDLLGGHLNVVGSSIASAISLIRSGDLRPIAVSSPERSPSLPDVPTFRELGIKDSDVTVWYGLLGPARMPDAIRDRLNAEVNKAIQRPEVIAAFAEQGLEPAPQAAQAFGATIETDYRFWSGAMESLGIKRE